MSVTITLPSFKEFGNRADNSTILNSTPIKERVNNVFVRRLGETLPEEELFEMLGYFFRVLPGELEKVAGVTLSTSQQETAMKDLVEALISDSEVRQRAFTAIHDALSKSKR